MSTALTNPSIEMGLIHSRVLLEFLGLKLKKGTLCSQATSIPTDVTVEDFGLTLVTKEQALGPCNGDKAKAEQSFVHTITAANKLVAHSSEIIEIGNEAIDSYLVCSKAIPVLFNLYFYQPLGLSLPKIELSKFSANNM